MTFDVYIIGGGAKMVDFLNGVAMYANANGITLTARIAFAVGIFWMMCNAAIQKIKMTDMFSYIFLTMIFIGVVINVKVDTYVHDPVNPQINGRKVSNVPLGLAWLVSTTTKIDYALTTGVETVFTTPDNLKFSQSGMMMGQDMVVKSTQVTISNQVFKQNLDNFVQQCVLYDIKLGHYTFDEVVNSKDMWAFFVAHANTKSRAFKYTDSSGTSYVTCYDGIAKLDNTWNGIYREDEVMKFAKQMFPTYGQEEAKSMVASLLPVSYEAIVGVSDNAANILRQNMMINLYYNAVGSFSMSSDSSTASQAYIDARTELQTMNTNNISGQQNGKWLIYMKTTLLLILVGLFVLMAPFATLPGGFKKFVNLYAGLFFMVCMWGPIFAFLNYIQMSESIDQTAVLTDGRGLTGLTKPGIAIINARVASSAASFFGYVPYLSIALLGVGSGLSSMLQSGLSASARAASAVANDVTMGTINLGNTSQGVHGYNNLSANKFDTSGSFSGSGMFSTTTSAGNQLTQFADGSTALKTSGAYSQLDSAGLFSKEGVSKSLSQEGQRLIDTGTRAAADYSDKRSSVISGGINNSLNRFDHKASGSSWSYGEDSRESKAARYVQNVAQRMSDTFGVSYTDASQLVGSMYTKAKWNSEDLMFGLGKLVSATGGSLEVGGSVSADKRATWSNQDIQQWVKDNVNSQEMNSSLETLFNASRNQNISDSSGQGIDGRTTYGESADWAQTRIDSAAADIRKGESFRQASSEMASSSFDMSQNYQQAFFDWLKTDKGMSNSQLDELFKSENMGDVRKYSRDFMQSESDNILKEWQEYQQTLGKDFKGPTSDQDVETTYKKNKSDIATVDNTGIISSAYGTTSEAEQLSLDNDSREKLKDKVNKGIDGTSDTIVLQSQNIPKPKSPTEHSAATNDEVKQPATTVTHVPYMERSAGYLSSSNQPIVSKTNKADPTASTPNVMDIGTTVHSTESFSLKDTVLNNDNGTATDSMVNAHNQNANTNTGSFTSLLDYVKQNLNQPNQSAATNSDFSLIVKPEQTTTNEISPQEEPVRKEFDLESRMSHLTRTTIKTVAPDANSVPSEQPATPDTANINQPTPPRQGEVTPPGPAASMTTAATVANSVPSEQPATADTAKINQPTPPRQGEVTPPGPAASMTTAATVANSVPSEQPATADTANINQPTPPRQAEVTHPGPAASMTTAATVANSVPSEQPATADTANINQPTPPRQGEVTHPGTAASMTTAATVANSVPSEQPDLRNNEKPQVTPQQFSQSEMEVRDLRAQVSEMQNQKFSSDFDVFKGLNEPAQQAPQQDDFNGKSSITDINPNSLKQ
ncbi:conjugal transfer protein TraG N-terminal domain-containing protein [Vibrio fluvialis]|uniref:conjugal transfer protein TraG N-terminal domain-containing protein n=1 Tax=Vibrio fluvialis TaxID=676 RepID=UPI001EEA23EB|nr:conjugal transfer protein TraG N-terminal domain-containing protein [Vibrio fluvialis]MCG6391837.1 conjugal transfer protein TraG N-terminal domain-containing protein [Vibrio fluvialis]